MALKHDAQGFLVGDPIDLSALVAEWAGIREDVRAIRQAVLGIEQAMGRGEPESTPVAVAVPGRSTGLEETDPAVKALSEVAQPVIAIPSFDQSDAPAQHQQPESARPAPSIASVPATADAARQIPVLLRTPATPRANAAGGRREGTSDAAVNRVVAELRATRAATISAPVQPPRRDSRGRFVKGPEANQSKPGKRPDGSSPREEEEREESLARSLADRVTGAVREASTGLEETDPAVKALSEVAQPVARGFDLMTGGDGQKKQERWLRRIFNTLTGSRKEQGLFNKIAAKRLKAIEEKPAEKSGGGILGGLLGGLGEMLMKIPVIGGLLSAGGAAAGGIGKLLMGSGKGFLRKIPILGGLLASFGAAAEIYSAETDSTLTRGEKDKRTGKAAGGLAGTLGGLWAGAKLGAAVGALGGPIGAAIGGVVGGAAGMFFGDRAGQVVGQTVGGWVSDLREADIGGMIAQKWDATVERFSIKWDEVSERFSSKWNELTDGLKSKWDSLIGDLKGLWGDITSAAEEAFDWVKKKGDQANDYIKSVTGVDVKETARTAVNSTKEVAASAIASVRSAGNAANETVREWTGVDVKESAGRAVSAARDGVSWVGGKAREGASWVGGKATDAKDWVLGKTSKLFESGRGGAGTVSTGRGDHGGASYGTYQLASNTGTLQKFLDSSPYGAQFSGLKPGTREFNDKWKQIAKDDPGFGDAQHDFIKRTHFDPQMEKLRKSGIDFSGRGAAVKDAVWSTSVQFGGNSSLIEKALNGRDVERMSDAEIVSAIQDYKIQNNDRLFASSSGAVRRGTLNRAHQEKERLLELARADLKEPAGENVAATGPASPASPDAAGQYTMQARRDADRRLRAENEERVRRNLEAAGQTTPMMEQERALAAAPVGSGPVASAATPAAPAAPVVVNAPIPASVSLAAPAAPAVAVASVPAVPSAPASPPIADAPPVSVPMASGDSRKPVAVVSAQPEVGQDLRERGIAHIATGGLGKG